MSQKYGIENLKEIIIWKTDLIEEIYELIEKAKKRKAKGRKPLTGGAALKFIDNLIKGIMIGTKYEQIALEWMDLDKGEKDLLQQLVKARLDIQDEFAQEVAERLFYLMIETGDTMMFIFSKKNQKV